ncbi:MAG TPA: hypothetical protein VN702_15925, partial [Acetobacteraceae bacterium]|nr:hypothetical protein [Acetobacteraceae bacterium]
MPDAWLRLPDGLNGLGIGVTPVTCLRVRHALCGRRCRRYSAARRLTVFLAGLRARAFPFA